MDKLEILLNCLLQERPEYHKLSIPTDLAGKRKLLRALMNIRQPQEAKELMLRLQDEELEKKLIEKGIVCLEQAEITVIDKRLKLWQGDITRLKVDAIVNAANSQMLGCFVPLHRCIDNAIHSAAGIQMRLECNDFMKVQGHYEPTGSAKLTGGYNLPSKYVIHTVGPIIMEEKVNQEDEYQLTSCYRSCLKLADEYKIQSIAFCCISTGEFRFPNQRAAEIAVSSVLNYLVENQKSNGITVIFNVYKDLDYAIYQKLLQKQKG